MPPRTIRTVCPRNCYCTCGMLVTLDGGRITRIEGDPRNPATGGHVCLKGISYARRVTTGDRLLRPLRRRPSGTGFEPVSWNEALSDIAGRLDRIRREAGPGAVLYYEGSGSHGALGQLSQAFWRQFGGCTLTYGDLCWPAGLEATRLTYGANLHSHPRLTVESRFILLWGHNPAETNVHQMRLIHEARARGATVALIDPRSTDTSDAVDLHLKPRPGTDAALALGLARAIIDRGLEDRGFLARYASGADEYVARLRDYPVGAVAATTGVAAAEIEALAGAYARADPALLIAGFGLQRTHHAGQTMRAVAVLPALTGNVGVPGGGWQYANLASHCLREPPLPPEPPAVRRAIPVSRLGPGIAQLASPRLRAAWIEKANPVSQNPRADLVRQALAELDLVVVVDQFLTETAAVADYVLPAKTMFEEADLVTAYWHPYLQLRAKVFDPPGEVRTETEIWRRLSAHLGLDTRYFPEDTGELLRAMLPPGHGPLLERLAEEPVDMSDGEVAFADRRFPTPSGKVEFWSDRAAKRWNIDPLPRYEPLPEGHASPLAARYPLQLLSCKTRDRIHSQFGNLDWVREVERPHVLDIHPGDARARGLGDGDRAAVFNDRGRVELRVRLDHGIRPGVVNVPEGRSHEGDPEVNVLTDAGVTDVNHGATFYECLVEVERVAGPPAGRSAVPVGRRPRRHEAPGAASDTARRVGFVVDLDRCVGCSACVLACRLENGWPSASAWRRVLPLNLSRRRGGPTYFLSLACHHCESPACLAGCPSGAYEKRPDGIVLHREERCLGCRYCEMACPFGAPRFDPARGVVAKCDLCHVRLDAGEAPACVAACPAEALRLGPEPDERATVPGFADPAGCRPNVRFRPPGGAQRAAAFAALLEALR